MGFRTPAGADNTPVTRPTTTDDNDKKASQKQCALLKIPPTVKDPRKLFVGGLPSNGRSRIDSSCVLCTIEIMRVQNTQLTPCYLL